jgi:hypothetical protein
MMDMNNDSDEDSFREGYEESSVAVASIDGLTDAENAGLTAEQLAHITERMDHIASMVAAYPHIYEHENGMGCATSLSKK